MNHVFGPEKPLSSIFLSSKQTSNLSLSIFHFFSLSSTVGNEEEEEDDDDEEIERFVKKKVSNSLPAVGEFGDF